MSEFAVLADRMQDFRGALPDLKVFAGYNISEDCLETWRSVAAASVALVFDRLSKHCIILGDARCSTGHSQLPPYSEIESLGDQAWVFDREVVLSRMWWKLQVGGLQHVQATAVEPIGDTFLRVIKPAQKDAGGVGIVATVTQNEPFGNRLESSRTSV